MEIIESILWGAAGFVAAGFVAAGFVPTILSMEALTRRRTEKNAYIGGMSKKVQKEVIMHRG